MMEDNNSIKALVRLIEDPDEGIYNHIRDELISQGSKVIPILESSWENEDYGLLFQTRIENLIREIQLEEVRRDLNNWIQSSEKDLLQGAIIVSRYQYPNLDEQAIHEKIQEIRKDIWLELGDNRTPYEQVRIFNKIFYGSYGFSGNAKDFHSPLNSCMNTVLEMRKGNPLSLSIIYSVIAQSIDMPVYGVNLPNHFVLAYLDANGINSIIDQENPHGTLFYINAYSKGGIFDNGEIKAFLKGLNIAESRDYFEPCSNSAIISRMLTNLIISFQQAGNSEKVKELTQLRDLFNFNV